MEKGIRIRCEPLAAVRRSAGVGNSLKQVMVHGWLNLVATRLALAFARQREYRLGVDARVDTVAAGVDTAASALRARITFEPRSRGRREAPASAALAGTPAEPRYRRPATRAGSR